MTTVISKTIYQFAVLHRTDQRPESLDEALAEADDGHAVGTETWITTIEVPDQAVAHELDLMGNDGTFFDEDIKEQA